MRSPRTSPGTLAKLAGAVCATLGAPITLAAKSGVPDGSWWDSPGDPAVIALVAMIAATIVYGITKGHDEFIGAKRQEERERLVPVEQACRSAMTPIARELEGVPLNELGIHLWHVDEDRLRRVVKYTMDLERRETPVGWTRGKGVIGLVWDTGVPLATDLTELYARAEHMTDVQFESDIPPVERYRMTRAELMRGSSYRCVLAIPLSSSDYDAEKTTIGVLSVDCMRPGYRDRLDRLQNDPQFSNVVGICQSYLRSIHRDSHA